MTDPFETKLRAALGNSRSSSRNRSAFALDIQHYVEKTGLFSRIQPQVWNPAPLGFGGEYDVYEFQHSTEDIHMRFVTVADHEALVTGEVFVTGFAEREFGRTVAERDEAGIFERWVFDK
jgi:hypothetical protein